MSSAFAKFDLNENCEFTLRDASGKIKKLFQPWSLVSLFIKKTGIQVPQLFPFGRWQDSLKVSNLITDAGRAAIASRINGAGAAAAFTYLALGTSNTAATNADTALGAEIVTNNLTRAGATCTRVMTTVANDTAQDAYTWTASGSSGIQEVGVLNDPTTGTLLAHTIFAIVNVSAGDSFTMTYKVAVS